MQKYAVVLGDDLGKRIADKAQARGFSLTVLVRFILWEYLDKQGKPKEKSKK